MLSDFFICVGTVSHILGLRYLTLSEPWLTFVTSGTSKSVQCLIWYSFWCLSKNISLLIYFIHFNGKDCVKDVRIRSFSCPYFPALGLNLDRYSLSLCIQSGCAKTRTRKTPSSDTFHAVNDSKISIVNRDRTIYFQ